MESIVPATLVAVALLVTASAAAEEANPNLRYGIPVDPTHFSQDGAQQTVRSIVRALDDGKVSYMLAHLIAPEDIDAKLKFDRAALRRLAGKATAASTEKLRNALVDHLEQGRWIIKGGRALSEVQDRADLTLERVGGRWYMHNVPRRKTAR
jgi:lambda repressor-like predicted transcriptional regulator